VIRQTSNTAGTRQLTVNVSIKTATRTRLNALLVLQFVYI